MKTGFARIPNILGSVLLLILLCQRTEGGSTVGSISLGTCPTITASTAAFNPLVPVAAGSRTWFLAQRFSSKIDQTFRCVTYTFTAASNTATTMTVTISGRKVLTGSTVSVTGTLTLQGTTFGSWRAFFTKPTSSLSLHSTKFPTSYSIIGVDPAATAAVLGSWVVLYNCQQIGPFFIENLWILSASLPMTAANLAAAQAAALAAGVTTSRFVQSSC